MKKFVAVTVIAIVLASCGGSSSELEQPMGSRKLDGSFEFNGKKEQIYAGGTFKMNEVEDLQTLYPHALQDVVSDRIASQIYQGLVRLNRASLEVEPCLAESYSVSDDGLTYSFQLRKGVKFQDNACFEGGQGRELTAQDVQYCFTRLCEEGNGNVLFALFTDHVKGAAEHYEASKNSGANAPISGIEVLSDYELNITLNEPFAVFPKLLAHNGCWIFPKEAVEKYGADLRSNPVGTGAFQVRNIEEGKYVLLVRNDHYWEKDEFGNALPYLDALKFHFAKEKKTELIQFKKKKLDMVFELPVEEMNTVMGTIEEAQNDQGLDYQYQVLQGLSTQYYGFLHTYEIFKDLRIRKAFNLAIDRKTLVEYSLSGAGEPALNGFVPPSMLGYDADLVKGFEFNPEEAKRLLAEAGYPDGKGFPEITLYYNQGGQTNTIAAQAVRGMIQENLGIAINIEQMLHGALVKQFSTGKCELFRSAWVADYPDAENFLKLFYGKDIDLSEGAYVYPNGQRYQNPKFDSIYEIAIREKDEGKRQELYAQCDQLLIDDAAYLNLYYDQSIRLLGLNVRNFPQNSMEHRDMSRVFFAKEEKK